MDAVVTLTAAPDAGFLFGMWTSCDSGALTNPCMETMDAANGDRTIAVAFFTPEEATEELIDDVQALDAGLNQGSKNSLKKKLENAIKALDKDDVADAIQKINDFINQVMAQSGKKISVEDADALIALANAILAAI